MSFIFLFAAGTIHCSAQTFRGKVTDEESNPLAFVNIGVVGQNIGTVSDEGGNFSIELSDQYNENTLKFSMIGFTSKEFKVIDFKNKCPSGVILEITLEKSMTTLREVTVTPKEYVTRITGNTSHSTSFIAGFESNDLGSEVGTVMKIRKAPAFIESVNFNIINRYDSVTFRLNVYRMIDGSPGNNILPEPIYVTAFPTTKRLTVDLKKYHLEVNDDFFVSLEWIKDLKGHDLYFCGGFFNDDSFSRKTSQGNWKKVDVLGLGFYSTVSYEK